MRLYSLLFLSCTMMTAVSCEKKTSGSDPVIPASSVLNISYSTDALQKVDIYLPANRSITSTKAIILIHGGGWTSGDKADFTPFVDTLKRRLPDYAIFNINYRLSATPYNLFPTQENDLKAAIQFILNKAGQYLISNKYVIMGASAGGHLAMLQAYKNSTVKPKAVVSFFGISDMTAMYNNPVGGNPLLSILVAQAVGKIPAQDPTLYASSSPINYITTASAIPTIFLHGGADPLVRPAQSTDARDKLVTAGVATQYVYYPAGGHGDGDNATYADAFNKVEAFIKLYAL